MKQAIEVIKDEDKLLKVQFCVPPIGTEIVLAEDWTFMLHKEYRNAKLWETMGLKGECEFWSKGKKAEEVTIPKGSRLTVSRIYIRCGKKEYDSITFTLKKHATDKKIKGRFWAKLGDVNKIICFPIGDKVETESVFAAFNPATEFRFLDV